MQNMKLGVVVCALIGLVGCFLPMVSNVSFFDMRVVDSEHVLVVMGGFATALVMGALGVAKGMARWIAIITIVGFGVVVLRMRGEVLDLLKAGIGAKLMGIAAYAGLVFAILSTVKPEPVK
jgi:hypothetical protein